jgi:hypothetical protein
MKNEFFNEREKRLFSYFSKKDDFYKGCYVGETKPIIDNKINKIEKEIVAKLKVQLNLTVDKDERDLLLEIISLYEKPLIEAKIEDNIEIPNIVQEPVVEKPKVTTPKPFVFKTAPYRKNYSRAVYWCNAYEPINKGKLGSAYGWKEDKKNEKKYY